MISIAGAAGNTGSKVHTTPACDIARKAAEILIGNPFTGYSVTDLFGHRLIYAQAEAFSKAA